MGALHHPVLKPLVSNSDKFSRFLSSFLFGFFIPRLDRQEDVSLRPENFGSGKLNTEGVGTDLYRSEGEASTVTIRGAMSLHTRYVNLKPR